MKTRYWLFLMGIIGLALIAAPLWAATGQPKEASGSKEAPGQALARTITEVTGVAISPLMGMTAVGAYTYLRTEEEKRSELPWYCHPAVFGAGLLLVGGVFAKDTLGLVVPTALKKPMDVLEAVENKASGLVGTVAFVPITVGTMGQFIEESFDNAVTLGDLGMAGGALAPMAAIDFTPVLSILMIPLMMAVFVLVWLVSHAINVLILISPLASVDAALKSFRVAVLGALTALSMINPWLGALLSLVLVVVAWLLAGWAFRLTVFGSVFVWDIFTFGRSRLKVDHPLKTVFLARKVQGVPLRTLGRLEKRADGTLIFSYRPWLVRPRTDMVLPAGNYAVGKGAFFASIQEDDPDTQDVVDYSNLITLPPRYRTHEDELGKLLGLPVVDAGLRKGVKSVIRGIRWLCGMELQPANHPPKAA